MASSRFGIVEAALRVKGCGGVTRHKAGTVMDSVREAMIVKRHQSRAWRAPRYAIENRKMMLMSEGI